MGVVESSFMESRVVESRVVQQAAGLMRAVEIGMPTWPEERCRDADSRPRFIAVHFPRWVIELEVALLRRAMARCPQTDHNAVAVDASPPINDPEFLTGIDLPLIVVREHHRVQHVVGICPLAYAAGVRVGMTMAQAGELLQPFCGAETSTSTPVAFMSTHMAPEAMQSSTNKPPTACTASATARR